ncbi:ParM/StbA family protein [Enterococcus faecalis]|nr:ParM/StbA family protein [Enterococcus faecalis]
MTKKLFAIDLGNKSAKLMKESTAAVSIPSRYLNTYYVNGSNRFSQLASTSLTDSLDIHKYQLVNEEDSFYFGKDVNKLGKDSQIIESFGVGKDRYAGESGSNFKRMLSFCIATLAQEFSSDDVVQADLVLGLPTEDYNIQLIESLIKAAKRQHSVEIDGSPVNVKIAKVHVLPQPIGTFYNFIFNDSGEQINPSLVQQKTGIVDIGGLTKLFDSLLNFQMDSMEREQKDTGAFTLYGEILDQLDMDSSVKPNKYQIEEVVRTGVASGGSSFVYYPRKAVSENAGLDLTTTIKKSIDMYTTQTINEIRNVFTHLSSFDNLIFTGGGSQIINKKLITKAFPNINIIFSDDGEFSNVKGFYKYGLTQ